MADAIIARIPPLPELREQAGWWSVDLVANAGRLACPTCYWRRCVSHTLVQAMRLEKDQGAALRDACWAKLVDPKQLPAYPDFWYGDPPREVKTSTWDVGKHQLP